MSTTKNCTNCEHAQFTAGFAWGGGYRPQVVGMDGGNEPHGMIESTVFCPLLQITRIRTGYNVARLPKCREQNLFKRKR